MHRPWGFSYQRLLLRIRNYFIHLFNLNLLNGAILARYSETRELNKMMFASRSAVEGDMTCHIHLFMVQGTGLGSAKRQVNVKSYEIHREI